MQVRGLWRRRALVGAWDEVRRALVGAWDEVRRALATAQEASALH